MKECKTCDGYGLWLWGYHIPMGKIDAKDGYPTVPCTECGCSYNDGDKKVRKLSRRMVRNG